MPDKSELRNDVKRLKRVKTWQLIAVLILLVFVSATLLRLNNIGMLQRREAVLNADMAGDRDATINALIQLQQYSAAHMNADTRVFYLEGAYKAAVKSAYQSAATYSDPNGNVNVQVDAICKPRFTQYSQQYTMCFAEELKKFPAAPNPAETVKFPNTDLFRYDYVSPRFSFDFAGLSVLLCGALVLIIVARFVALIVLNLMVRHRYKSV